MDVYLQMVPMLMGELSCLGSYKLAKETFDAAMSNNGYNPVISNLHNMDTYMAAILECGFKEIASYPSPHDGNPVHVMLYVVPDNKLKHW